MRSADIATRCREIALRVEISGEWGELAETLREAAEEVERLRLEPSVQEEIVAWSVDLHDAREKIKRLEAEVDRLRKLSAALRKYGSSRDRAARGYRIDCEKLTAEVERLRKSEAALLRELKIESGQVSADQDRIKSLEAEVERLRLVGSDSQILKRAAQLMCDHEPHFLVQHQLNAWRCRQTRRQERCY